MAPAPQKQPVAAPVPQLRKASQPQVPAAVAQFQAAATSNVRCRAESRGSNGREQGAVA